MEDTDHEVDRTSESHAHDFESYTLGYLICPQTADKGFVGALLITDYWTRPLHFAYVSPVRPTGMQRILYGSTLTPHVKIDVISKRLLTDGLPISPSIVFVDAADLLESRRLGKWPVAFLAAGKSGPSSLSTLRYDCGSSASAADMDFSAQVVASLESTTDLLAPFQRLREALKEAIKIEPV